MARPYWIKWCTRCKSDAHDDIDCHNTPAPERVEPKKIEPGSDEHLTLMMAPWHLNLLTGKDRADLLAFAGFVWREAKMHGETAALGINQDAELDQIAAEVVEAVQPSSERWEAERADYRALLRQARMILRGPQTENDILRREVVERIEARGVHLGA